METVSDRGRQGGDISSAGLTSHMITIYLCILCNFNSFCILISFFSQDLSCEYLLNIEPFFCFGFPTSLILGNYSVRIPTYSSRSLRIAHQI